MSVRIAGVVLRLGLLLIDNPPGCALPVLPIEIINL
jgi:hypothetical protein